VTKIYLILLLVAANLPYITFEVVFRKNARADQLYIVARVAPPSSELVDPNRRRGCHFRATSHPKHILWYGIWWVSAEFSTSTHFRENPIFEIPAMVKFLSLL
jgi:hypothetical protein